MNGIIEGNEEGTVNGSTNGIVAAKDGPSDESGLNDGLYVGAGASWPEGALD